MSLTLRVLAAVALVVAVAGCEPTGDPRCDAKLWDIQARIEHTYGWRLSCDPQPDPRYKDRGQLGQTGPDKTVWLWPDRTIEFGGVRLLRKVAWHELGHVVHIERGMTFATTEERERWADGFAWCAERIMGVGYRIMPSDCGPYR